MYRFLDILGAKTPITYTPEEAKRLDELETESKKINDEFNKLTHQRIVSYGGNLEIESAEDFEKFTIEKDKFFSLLNDISEEEARIDETAEKRYIENSTEETIINDVKIFSSSQGSKIRFEMYQSMAIEFNGVEVCYDDEEGSEEPQLKSYRDLTPEELHAKGLYIGAEPYTKWLIDWILSATFKAAKAKGLDKQTLVDIIAENAAVLYPKGSDVGGSEHKEDIKPSPVRNRRKSELIRTITPKYYLSTVDKASNSVFFNSRKFFKDFIEGQLTFDNIPMNMGKKGEEPVNALLSINYSEAKLSRPLTPFENSVLSAVHSYFDIGQTVLSIPMIYRFMNGLKDGEPTKKQAEEIKAALYALKAVDVIIDYTEEVRAGFIAQAPGDEKATYYIKGSPLTFVEAVKKLRGTKTSVFKISVDTPPVFYAYASLKSNGKGHIEKRDIKILDIPLSFTKSSITLREILYNSILRMERSPELSHVITFDSIYEQIEIAEFIPGKKQNGLLRNKKQRIRNDTFKILDYWKNIDFIKGYSPIKKSGIVSGIEIKPTPKSTAKTISKA